MFVNKQIIKSSIIFTSIALALTILFTQVYIIINEDSITKLDKKDIFLDALSKAKYCQEKKFNKYTDVLIKCALAFFGGCLISEMKFLKTGII